jgi:hypothetical protein
MKHRQFLIGVLVGLALGIGPTAAIFLTRDRKSPTMSVASSAGAGHTLVAAVPATPSHVPAPPLPEGAMPQKFNGQWFYLLPLNGAVAR